MHGHEGGGAGRVHGHRRPFQTEGVGDPSGDDGAGAAGHHVRLGHLGPGGDEFAVVVAAGTGEDADGCAAQRVGVDAGAFERLPGHLQDQPLLGVHGQRLAGADAEEAGVEAGDVVDEAALTDVRGARAVLVGVQQGVQVPSPVVGEGADGVTALGDQPPQVLR